MGFGEIDGFGFKGFLFEELFVRGLVGVRFEICIWGFIRGIWVLLGLLLILLIIFLLFLKFC